MIILKIIPPKSRYKWKNKILRVWARSDQVNLTKVSFVTSLTLMKVPFFTPLTPLFAPLRPPRYQLRKHLSYWYDVIYSKEEIEGIKVWKKVPPNTGPPGGVKRGVRGVTHSFFDLFSKNWPFLKSASPCDSNGMNGFVLYSFRCKKKLICHFGSKSGT